VTGQQVRRTRQQLGLTQQQAARRWKMSQTYVSLVERGQRPVPPGLARRLAATEPALATGLPLEGADVRTADLPSLLGSLGYPGFAYLGGSRALTNPAVVVLAALRSPETPARVVEALPWVLLEFPDLDWNWLLDQAKLGNLQNRLGFVVTLAREVAERKNDASAVARLERAERVLGDARLAREDTLGRRLTEPERSDLRQHRPATAAHWNVLTRLEAADLRYEP